jgi:hypothetical protein
MCVNRPSIYNENNPDLTKQYKNQTNLSSLDLLSHSNWIVLQF